MGHKINCITIVLVNIFCCFADTEISDKDYAIMPEVFHLDDYDRCMMLVQDKAIYCTFTFELQPIDLRIKPSVWKVIKNVTSDPRNYRHDRLRHGVCLPTFCQNAIGNFSNLSVKDTIEKCYNKKYFYMGLKGNVTRLRCESADSQYPIDAYDITVAFFFIFYVVFVIFASIYEGMATYGKNEAYEKITGTLAGKVIAAFSIRKNWHRLTSENTNADAKKLRSIQGIRFYNMICIIFCHTIMLDFYGPVANTKYTENMTRQILNMFVANGNYVVQTFFVISSWLLSFHFFQMMEERKNITLKLFLLSLANRYIRLTPLLAVMISFESTWLVHLGRGPNWDSVVGTEYRNCRKNWWTNLLYVNNYIDNNNMCLHQTWFIASDTQLYALYLLLLIVLWKNQNKCKTILGFYIVVGLIVQGGIAYIKDYDIVIRQYPEALYELNGVKNGAWHDLYSAGYSNITGYAIGITFGYIFYKTRNNIVTVTKIQTILWWILTFGLGLFIILIAGTMYDPKYESTPLKSTLYWALGKNIFALGAGVLILGFTHKIGWFARWFCEWQPVSVLGRLTYSTYITHTALIRMRSGSLRAPLYANDYLILMTTLGDIVLSYLVGTLVCLIYEMPITALQKLMVPQLKTRKSTDASENYLETPHYNEHNPTNNKKLNACI